MKIVILTGAGISQESGISTFRDEGGLWAQHNIEDVATPMAFQKNPSLVYKFYNQRRKEIQKVSPNDAHHALAKLEREFPGEVFIVTQNVDHLHEMSGGQNIIHMHGELLKVRCLQKGTVHSWKDNLNEKNICPCCQGKMRPHIVWFGEMPLEMERIQIHLETCDLFISIGTSGEVYPAAMFHELASKAKTVQINLEQTYKSSQFDEQIFGPATESVPLYVEELLNTLKSQF